MTRTDDAHSAWEGGWAHFTFMRRAISGDVFHPNLPGVAASLMINCDAPQRLIRCGRRCLCLCSDYREYYVSVR